MLDGRDYVVPDDVKALAGPVKELGAKEIIIELAFFVPAIKSHTNLAVAIKKAARDEGAGVCCNIDLGAIRRVAFHLLNRTGEHPGVSPKKRLCPLGE